MLADSWQAHLLLLHSIVVGECDFAKLNCPILSEPENLSFRPEGRRLKPSRNGGISLQLRISGLFRVRQCADVKFQRLIILALDLQLGLQLFDQHFQVRDFCAQLQLHR